MGYSDEEMVKYDYRRYLISLLDDEKETLYLDYSMLCEALDEVVFEPDNVFDESRCVDALTLRDDFDQKFNKNRVKIKEIYSENEVSYLEVLTKLLVRQSEIVTEPGEKGIECDTFFAILGYCGLKNQTNFECNKAFVKEKIVKKYHNVILFGPKFKKYHHLWEACGYWVSEHFCG